MNRPPGMIIQLDSSTKPLDLATGHLFEFAELVLWHSQRAPRGEKSWEPTMIELGHEESLR